MEKGSERNLFKKTVADFLEFEHFDLHKLMGDHIPQLDFYALPAFCQSCILLEDKPSAFITLLRSEILLVKSFSCDSDLTISRLQVIIVFLSLYMIIIFSQVMY